VNFRWCSAYVAMQPLDAHYGTVGVLGRIEEARPCLQFISSSGCAGISPAIGEKPQNLSHLFFFCPGSARSIAVQYSNCGRVSQTSALASERSLLMRVPRGPSNVPQSLRSGMQAIEITTKPAVNSSTR
jgi:hypothetical protein